MNRVAAALADILAIDLTIGQRSAQAEPVGIFVGAWPDKSSIDKAISGDFA